MRRLYREFMYIPSATTTTGNALLQLLDRLSVNCQGMIGAMVGNSRTVSAIPVLDGLRKWRSELFTFTVSSAFEAIATAAANANGRSWSPQYNNIETAIPEMCAGRRKSMKLVTPPVNRGVFWLATASTISRRISVRYAAKSVTTSWAQEFSKPSTVWPSRFNTEIVMANRLSAAKRILGLLTTCLLYTSPSPR